MYFIFYFKKIHLIFVFYFFIELSKRLIKEQQNKLFSKNAFRNLQMFLSHTTSILFYFVQNKNMGKEMIKNNKFPSKNILYKEEKQNLKHIRKKYLLLIFLTSILHLISYYPLKEYDIINFDCINIDNITGLFVIILFLVEKKILKTKFCSHHILSIILLSLLNIFIIFIDNQNSSSSNILKILYTLVIYSIYHYLTLALVYNIFYYINNKYFISLYYIFGIQGLISFILTIFFILLFKDNSIIEIYNNTTFNEYIWPFLVFICMSIENILQILILYFFKPSFICIIYVIVPLINLTSDILKLIFSKEDEFKYKGSIFFLIIYQFIILFSVLVYIEILVLTFYGLDKGVKNKIIIRSENEKKDLNSFEINSSNTSNNSILNSFII